MCFLSYINVNLVLFIKHYGQNKQVYISFSIAARQVFEIWVCVCVYNFEGRRKKHLDLVDAFISPVYRC